MRLSLEVLEDPRAITGYEMWPSVQLHINFLRPKKVRTKTFIVLVIENENSDTV